MDKELDIKEILGEEIRKLERELEEKKLILIKHVCWYDTMGYYPEVKNGKVIMIPVNPESLGIKKKIYTEYESEGDELKRCLTNCQFEKGKAPLGVIAVGSGGCERHCPSFIAKYRNSINDNKGVVCCYGDQK